MHNDHCILTINGGSSSIKFAVYKPGRQLKSILRGEIKNIGTAKSVLSFSNSENQEEKTLDVKTKNHLEAGHCLFDWLQKQEGIGLVKVVGHRVVQGLHHTVPELITPGLISELKKVKAYAPEHLPAEVKLIELCENYYPAVPQIACFDTSFHTAMPAVAKMLPLPRHFYETGIRRYGFHGLSYAYVMEELANIYGPAVANGKVIIAHLGSGASITAVLDGKSVDTSMGFTPTSGIPMSTRTGDLDPGVAWYLMKREKLTPQAFNHMINHQSGLLGISGMSADVRELLESEDADPKCAEAIAFFCYQTKKWIGSFITVLRGLETLIFTGGIGEHAAQIRSRICDGLSFYGVELDELKNKNNEVVISAANSRVTVMVIKTNEELMIAKSVVRWMNFLPKNM